jgi:hypothetical protein
MSMIVPMAAMGVAHHDRTTSERLAPDVAIKILQALHPASHQCAQQDCGVLREDGAEHGRDCEKDVAIDHALLEHRAHLAAPGIHGDFGAPQAQGRSTAHRHQMPALSTVQAAVLDIAHLSGLPHASILAIRPA